MILYSLYCYKTSLGSLKALALIWIYLQIMGTPVERMLAEENLWTFDRNDFEKACLFLVLENAVYRDESALQMRELISKHFTSENELALWSKDICEKVIFAINR